MARTLRAAPSALLIAIRFCPGASRQSIKRLQRAAVPASKLACTPATDPQRRYAFIESCTLLKSRMKKKIEFKSPIALGKTRDASDYLFQYDLVDSEFVGMPEEQNRTSHFYIKVGATRTLVACWGLSDVDLIKVLFEYGKRHVIQKLKDDTLSEEEELLLSTSTAEVPCLFDPSRIPDPAGTHIEVDLGGLSFMKDQAFLQLASSIIDTRDNINAIFSSINREKLILLNEERDLLQFFRDASTQEDFFYRICALANAATAFNLKILREITGISDTQVKSVTLLENYLGKTNSSSPARSQAPPAAFPGYAMARASTESTSTPQSMPA